MQPSAKCGYALLGLFALAQRRDPSPMKAAEIAEQHQIPIKFLEAILNQLKGGGFVVSRRGAEGGYLLAKPPEAIVLGDVIRLIDGPTTPTAADPGDAAPYGAFWARVGQAISGVIDRTTLADIVREHRERAPGFVADWTI